MRTKLDHLQNDRKWRGRRSSSMILAWKVYAALFMTFIEKRSTLRWNPCLLRLKRKGVCGGGLVILHAGGENGWIDVATSVFQRKKATGDYHDEMFAVHLEEWFHDSLIPNLHSNSLIVKDNAP